MAVEYGWDGSSWVPLTSAPPSSAEVWGEHLVTWDGTLWHYRGATIVDRPEANYVEGSRVLWDTSQDVTFTDPPPSMVSGDLWIPHEEISGGGGGGDYLPLTGGTLTGNLYINEETDGGYSLNASEINARMGVHIDEGILEIEDGSVRVWNGGLLVTGSVVNEIEALIEAWGGVMLPNPPVNSTDAVNKQYADSIVRGHTIQDEGTARTARAGLNFIGPAVAAADDSGNNRTNVTISTPNILVLGPSDPVPGGTPAGTVIIRTA